MKKTILLYGLIIAGLVLILKFMEYRLFIRDISMEVYIGLIALVFTVFGIWMGLKLTRPKVVVQAPAQVTDPDPGTESFSVDVEKLKAAGISSREYDVLELMSRGMSNQEIADQLFISVNTVKTHVSNLYIKLDSKRRTHAVQQAKEMGLLP